MAGERVRTRFGDVVEFVSEKAKASDANLQSYVSTENMLPDFGGVVAAASIPTSGAITRFRCGDVLFSNIRTYFKKVWRANFSGYCSNDVLVFRAKNERVILPTYVHNLCRWEKFTELSVRTSKGAKMPRGDKEAMAEFEFDLPPLAEQRAIAHILGTLDDKIELNRRRNETLEAMARALFKDWFVDFGPVRAKMQGRPPYLPPDLWQLFPDRLDKEGKPEGWESLPFGKLLESTIGGDWGKEHAEAENSQPVCIIRGTDIPGLLAGVAGKVPTRYTTPKKLLSRELQDGDIVVEVSGGSPTQPTGRSFQITESLLQRFPHPVVCASFCRRFRPVNSQLGTLAASHLTDLYQNGGTWEYQNQSTGISNFQTAHFLDAERVFVPDDEVLVAFAAFIKPIRSVVTSNESITLALLRDTLLPKLISGEIRVRNAE